MGICCVDSGGKSEKFVCMGSSEKRGEGDNERSDPNIACSSSRQCARQSARQSALQSSRHDARHAACPDTRHDARHAACPDTRHDARYAACPDTRHDARHDVCHDACKSEKLINETCDIRQRDNYSAQ